MDPLISEHTRGLLGEMSRRNLGPRNIEVSKLGDHLAITAYRDPPEHVISESVFTGLSQSGQTALLKCLSEMVERAAAKEWFCRNPKFEKFGTDGFAAIPAFLPNAALQARENAYFEAVERYCWARWWDDEHLGADVDEVFQFSDRHELAGLIMELLNAPKFFSIRPYMEQNATLQIYFCQIKPGGFISGGACGIHAEEVTERALFELYRHALAYNRLTSHSSALTPSFYERRLAFFASGRGDDLVKSRLERNTTSRIRLPPLQLDESVDHSNADLFLVHKCQFQGQPLFIGGPLERLCL